MKKDEVRSALELNERLRKVLDIDEKLDLLAQIEVPCDGCGKGLGCDNAAMNCPQHARTKRITRLQYVLKDRLEWGSFLDWLDIRSPTTAWFAEIITDANHFASEVLIWKEAVE